MKTADNAELCQVIEAIGLPAVLEQCAEELAELTQAALKMARKLRGENPTPMTHAQAAEHLHEELGDVRLCLKVLDVARRFFPKGTSFDTVTPEEVRAAEKWVNSYPRKLLGWQSAATLFEKELLSA